MTDPRTTIQVEAIAAELNIFLADKITRAQARRPRSSRCGTRLRPNAIFAAGPSVARPDARANRGAPTPLRAAMAKHPQVALEALYAFGTLAPRSRAAIVRRSCCGRRRPIWRRCWACRIRRARLATLLVMGASVGDAPARRTGRSHCGRCRDYRAEREGHEPADCGDAGARGDAVRAGDAGVDRSLSVLRSWERWRKRARRAGPHRRHSSSAALLTRSSASTEPGAEDDRRSKGWRARRSGDGNAAIRSADSRSQRRAALGGTFAVGSWRRGRSIRSCRLSRARSTIRRSAI